MGIEVTRDLTTMQQLRTVLIVGLGNIGPNYEQTRHNAGFLAVDDFADQTGMPAFSEKKQLLSLVSESIVDGAKLIVAKPTTFMNKSGEAVMQLQNYFDLGLDQIVVVYDDIDLDFGTIRTRLDGSDGGHKGIRSINQLIGEEYARIRIGVGDDTREHTDTGDYVLQRIPKAQWDQLDAVFTETNALLQQFINNSFDSTTASIDAT